MPSGSPLPTSLPVESLGLIDLDVTLFISGFIFLALYFFLKTTLLDRYVEIDVRREQLTSGASGAASELQARSSELMSDYQAKLADARREAASLREELKSAGKAEEARIVSAAREQAAAALGARRTALASEVSTAEQQITARAEGLAGAVVQQVLQ